MGWVGLKPDLAKLRSWFSVFDAYASRGHRYAAVLFVTPGRVDGVEVAQEGIVCLGISSDGFDDKSVLRDVYEAVVQLCALWNFVSDPRGF